MRNNNYCLLLTGTIDPSYFGNPNVVIMDINERLFQYEETITSYIENSVFTKIVFAENSGYAFDAERFEELARKNRKFFEFIKVHTDVDETKKRGKSFGESVLIREGIKKSKLFENEEVIYKSTGRVYLSNSKSICKDFNYNEFISLSFRPMCFSVFFKILKNDLAVLFDEIEYECDDFNGRAIENTIYRRIESHNICVKPFNCYPDIRGLVGTNGGTYNRSRYILFLKNILLKLGMYNFEKYNYPKSIIMKTINKILPDLWW